VLCVPEGKDVVVITSAGGAMTSETDVDVVCVALEESATVAVKLKVPLAEGVPEIRPVLAARLSPAGRLPEVIDHVYGVVPPVARRDLE
jgi:hypothetical protein